MDTNFWAIGAAMMTSSVLGPLVAHFLWDFIGKNKDAKTVVTHVSDYALVAIDIAKMAEKLNIPASDKAEFYLQKLESYMTANGIVGDVKDATLANLRADLALVLNVVPALFGPAPVTPAAPPAPPAVS